MNLVNGGGTMRRTRSIVRGTLLGVVLAILLAGPARALEVGDRAPDFTLTGSGGKPVKLADLLGKGPVVIYTFISAVNAV